MARIAAAYGTLMIAVGLAGYFGTGRASVTALIPAFFGAPVLACALIARKESARKHAMHVASLLGVLAAIASGMRLPVSVAKGAVSAALVSLAVMFVLSAGFVILCVRSFVVARLLKK